MHTKRLNMVANAIETAQFPDLGYNQEALIEHAPDHSGRNCGTVACVAGWAVTLRDGEVLTYLERLEGNTHSGICSGARDWLELSHNQSDLLFHAYPLGPDRSPDSAQAVRTIRHLAATGVVDWRA